MLVAITGYGTNIRSAPSAASAKRGVIGRGGLLAEFLSSESGWSNYNILAGASRGNAWISDYYHKKVAIEDRYLEVYFFSQLEGSDEPGDQDAADDWTGDCGFACVKMVAEAIIPDFTLSIDNIAKGYLNKDHRLGHINDILGALRDIKIDARHSLSLDIYGVTTALLDYKAVISLVDYEAIPGRVDPYPHKPYTGGHYIVLYGMDYEGVLYKNPYLWKPDVEDGKLTWAELIKLVASSKYNYAAQGIVIEDEIVG